MIPGLPPSMAFAPVATRGLELPRGEGDQALKDPPSPRCTSAKPYGLPPLVVGCREVPRATNQGFSKSTLLYRRGPRSQRERASGSPQSLLGTPSLISAETTSPPAASTTAWAAAVSHSMVGPKRG